MYLCVKFESFDLFGVKVIPELKIHFLSLPHQNRKRQKMEASLLLHFLLSRIWLKIETPKIKPKYHHYAPNTLNYSKTATTATATTMTIATTVKNYNQLQIHVTTASTATARRTARINNYTTEIKAGTYVSTSILQHQQQKHDLQ